MVPGINCDEQPQLSQSGVAQCKLLLYGTLVKHYSNTDRPPLLPPHMTDIYVAITDLLGRNCNFGSEKHKTSLLMCRKCHQ